MGRFEDLFDGADGERPGDFRCDRKKRVGAYVLGRTLGEGSFAKVRLGIHLISREKVAVKVVNKKAVLKRDYARRNLHREAAMLQRLQHPNIIRLYEVMETDNHYYIVTELADGHDFMGYISERYNLGEDECRLYMRQIVSAVDHMHHAGVIHRDLKIENLMFDKEMNVKLIDFGLSNTWDGQSLLTTQCGSPAYAAPEIFSKKPYGPTVDLWSVGVNLYAMLTGNLPFTADPPNNLTKLHAAILRGCNPPSNVSKECQDVLHGLMEVNETRRMTMAELKEHPWITEGRGPLDAFRPKTKPQESDLDNVVISHMVNQLGMDDGQIRDALLNNKVNAVTATYQLLCKRKMKGIDWLGPGLPPEYFSTQKWTTPNPVGELGTLKEGDLPHQPMDDPLAGMARGNNVGNIKNSKQLNLDNARMLQRKQMAPSVIQKQDSNLRLGSSGSRSTTSQAGSLAPSEPDPLSTPRINSGSTNTSGSTGRQPTASERIRLYRQSSVVSGAENYRDCLSKLRSHRERPNRSILKSESGKPVPVKTVSHHAAELKPEVKAQPIIIPVVTQQQAPVTTVVESGSGNRRDDNMLQLTPRRTTSATTKSVRFNLEPDMDDASTVVSFRSQPPGGVVNPSQMERLVLRRLSADKVRRDNILNMAKVHYNKEHWEINQEALDALRKRGSPDDGSSVVSAASSSGRARAMRALRHHGRSSDGGANNPPPAPPNSALGRHRALPSSSGSRHSTSAGPSAASARGQRLLQAQTQNDLPNGHLLARSRQVELLENSDNLRAGERGHGSTTSGTDNNNIRVQVRDDYGSRVLVWDLKFVDAAPGDAEAQQQRASLTDSAAPQRKLGTLRGQMAVKPKSNISDVDPKYPKGIYALPEREGTSVSRARLTNHGIGSTPKPFTAAQPIKVKLRSPRGGGLFAVKDPYIVTTVKGADPSVTK